MNRTTELEILAATLEEPTRALMRSALVAQRQGRLDAAARVCRDQVGKRPLLRWAALLLALEATELRMGGSVAITTPASRFVASDQAASFPALGFTEEWGPFGMIVYPRGDRLMLELVRVPGSHALALRAWPDPPSDTDAALALVHLYHDLEEHLDVPILRHRPTGP